MQHPVGRVSLWCFTLNKQMLLLFQITFSQPFNLPPKYILHPPHKSFPCPLVSETNFSSYLIIKLVSVGGTLCFLENFGVSFLIIWGEVQTGGMYRLESPPPLLSSAASSWEKGHVASSWEDVPSISTVSLFYMTLSQVDFCKIWQPEDGVTGTFNQSSWWHL